MICRLSVPSILNRTHHYERSRYVAFHVQWSLAISQSIYRSFSTLYFFFPKVLYSGKKKSRTTQRFCAGPYCFGNGHSLKAHDWLPVWHQPMTARVVELVEIIRQALNRVCVCVWNVYVCVCLYPRTIYVKTECMSVCIPVCVHDAHPSLYSGYWLKLMRSVIASLLSYIFVQSHSLSPISKPSFCCNFSP